MAVTLNQTNPHNGLVSWCRCCGSLNPATSGEYLRRLRRQVKRRERAAWKKDAR